VIVLLVATAVYRTRETGDSHLRLGAVDSRPAVTTRIGVFRGTDPRAVHRFGTWLGRDVDYVVDFSSRATWAQISDPAYLLDTWRASRYRMVYSVALLPQNPRDTMQRGAAGEYDHYYRKLAHRLVRAGQADAVLRLGWEFNLEDSRWATSRPRVFVDYFRHVVAAMREEPGQNFEFDWNPSNGKGKYDAVRYYPGNDVVDYVGVDAYDASWAFRSYPYPPGCDPVCRSGRQRNAWSRWIYGGSRGLRFWSQFARSKGKSMSLPEWGLWQRPDRHGGGDDPEYLRRMHAFITDPKNRVAYQAYFEFDANDGPHRLMTTYPESGQVFRELFGRPGG
jgi:hypothetical protein